MHVRTEIPADTGAIASVIELAFATAPFSSRTEQFIVRALREAGALTVSLVAEQGGAIVGHIAFSPVGIADGTARWYGLGPVAVAPSLQRQGIGAALVRAGLSRLQALGAAGCVVLGEPDYYGRFGFRAIPGLHYPGPPPEYFLAQVFSGPPPQGEVTYHAAFASTA